MRRVCLNGSADVAWADGTVTQKEPAGHAHHLDLCQACLDRQEEKKDPACPAPKPESKPKVKVKAPGLSGRQSSTAQRRAGREDDGAALALVFAPLHRPATPLPPPSRRRRDQNWV